MPWIALFALLAADPPGTVALQLTVGKTAPIQTAAGTHVICDDLTVVKPEWTEDGKGFILRGLKPGSTLCGVWLPDQVPGGLYRVTVTAEPARK
jgi:hypothetical protein